jgi:hypothetical protein
MSTCGQEHYLAAWPKLLIAGIIVVLLVVAAFRVPGRSAPRRRPDRPGAVARR